MNSAGSALYPLLTNSLTLTNSQLIQNSGCPYFVPVLGPGLDFENPSGFQCPDWWLTLTNRLRFAIVDMGVTPNRIVDYVNLEASGAPEHITDLLMQGGTMLQHLQLQPEQSRRGLVHQYAARAWFPSES